MDKVGDIVAQHNNVPQMLLTVGKATNGDWAIFRVGPNMNPTMIARLSSSLGEEVCKDLAEYWACSYLNIATLIGLLEESADGA